MTDTDTAPDLIELIVSRLAHELVGPVGAISNGLELVSELGADAGDDVHQLVTGSAEAASDRLAFYRLAYGRAGFGVTNAAQLRATVTAFYQHLPRHELSWPMPPVLPSLPDGAGRLVLILCEMAVDMAPRSGIISVVLEDNGVTVTSRGEEVGVPPSLAALLDGAGPISADTAHAGLARHYASKMGWAISADTLSEAVVLRANPI